MKDGYERVMASDLHMGDEVILEVKHFEYKTGRPLPSTYYRTVVDGHKTVAGWAFDLVSDPNWEYPEIPSWCTDRIYAQNGGVQQMWRRIPRDAENGSQGQERG